jgi:alpha-amylase
MSTLRAAVKNEIALLTGLLVALTGCGTGTDLPPSTFGVGVGSGQAASAIEFKYAAWFDKFLNVGGSTIGEFRGLSAQLGAFLPSAQAVVFTTNHDTERATAIFYQDGKVYDLATVFLLAFPYGYPSLMSSFAFDRTTSAGLAQGPPSDTMGHTNSIYAAGLAT